MITNYNRVPNPQPDVQAVSADFKTIRNKLRAGLEDAAALSEDRAYSQSLTALLGRPCPRMMVVPELATELKSIKFGFKKDADPAYVFPLRSMVAKGAQNTEFNIGLETKSSDVVINPAALNLSGFIEITELRTYYCTTRKSEGKKPDEYGVRLIALLFVGRNLQNEECYVYQAAASGPFSATTLNQNASGQSPTGLIAAVETAVGQYNSNTRHKDYYVYWAINDSGLQLSADNSEGNKVINIRYSSFIGASRTYIGNFSLISAVDIKATVSSMFENLEDLNFQIPFKKNPSGLAMTCTFGHGESKKNGTIDIFQKSTSSTFSIPQVGIGKLFTVGSIYSRTGTQTTTNQKEASVTVDRTDSVQLTVPVECYVSNSFPATPLDNTAAVVQFFYFTGEYGMQLVAKTENSQAVSTTKILRKKGVVNVEMTDSTGNPTVTVAGLGAIADNVYPGGGDPNTYQDIQLPFNVAKRNGLLFKIKQVTQGGNCVCEFSYNESDEAITCTQPTVNQMQATCSYYTSNNYATGTNYSISIPMNIPAIVFDIVNDDDAATNKNLTQAVIGFV